MFELDKQILDEIEDNFTWGVKVGGKGDGHNNLDDEQIQWMIKTIKQNKWTINNLKQIIFSKDEEIYNLKTGSTLSDVEREIFGLGDDF